MTRNKVVPALGLTLLLVLTLYSANPREAQRAPSPELFDTAQAAASEQSIGSVVMDENPAIPIPADTEKVAVYCQSVEVQVDIIDDENGHGAVIRCNGGAQSPFTIRHRVTATTTEYE
jgi:hypothetical protein